MKGLTITKMLSEYLRWRKTVGAEYISTHEFEHARNWIKETFNKLHTVGTLDREWRRMRAAGVVEAKLAKVPGKREQTWKIIEVHNPDPSAILKLQ